MVGGFTSFTEEQGVFSGSVTINGLDDSAMVIIFEHKAKHEKVFSFNPQQMQTTQLAIAQGGTAKRTIYDNVVLSWKEEAGGLAAVIDLLRLLDKHLTPPVAATP